VLRVSVASGFSERERVLIAAWEAKERASFYKTKQKTFDRFGFGFSG
jgi:hypothetical protein